MLIRIVFRTVAALSLFAASAWAQATVNESLETAFIYVDGTNGSDSNPGTQTLPLKTIGASILIATANNVAGIGTRVIVNPGTYREVLTVASAPNQGSMPMTFQAATNGTVLISGAVQYTGWSAYTGNSSIFTASWPNQWGYCAADGNGAPYEPQIVLRREMVFVNGAQMTQVLSLAEMIYPGSFFVDETHSTIYVWPPAATDMQTADVEVATNPTLLNVVSNNGKPINGIVFRGLTFQYGNPCHDAAAVNVSGQITNILFDTDSFIWNNGQGIALNNPTSNITVTSSIADHDGAAGFQAFQLKNILWQHNESSYNNWRGAQGAYYTWNSGGMHLFSDHNDAIAGHTAVYNQTFSIHWDTDTQNASADSVFSAQNLVSALNEKNEGPLSVTNSKFCSSSFSASGYAGFVLRNSDQTTIHNNLFYNNAVSQILVTGVAGGIAVTNWETGQNYNLLTQNVTITNNTIVGVGASQQVFKDGYLGGTDWTQFQSTLHSDFNDWWNASNSTPFTVPTPSAGTAETFAQWQSTSGQDANSSFAAPATDPAVACAVTFTAPVRHGASATPPDYFLLVDSGVNTIDLSGATVFNLQTVALAGFTGNVSFSFDGVSAIRGATATFSANPVAAGGSAALTFTAATTTPPGTYLFTVLSNSGSVTRTIALSVTVPTQTIRLTPLSLNFPNQVINTSSKAQVVKLTNLSKVQALHIGAITTTAGFTETNTCGLSLAANKSCTISVTFSPHSLQSYTGPLTINDGDPSSPQVVALTGTVLGAPGVSFNPTQLFFGNEFFNQSSPPLSTTMTNNGTATLNLSSIAPTGTNAGDFTQSNTCGSSLTQNASCVITVVFKPSTTKKETANISVTDNAGGSPQTVSVTGAGVTAVLLSPKTFTFSSQTVGTTSNPKVSTLTNLSAVALSVASITLTGLNAGDFSQTSTCSTALAGGANCTVNITFTPRATGTRTATVSINDSDPTSPQKITLTGTGK